MFKKIVMVVLLATLLTFPLAKVTGVERISPAIVINGTVTECNEAYAVQKTVGLKTYITVYERPNPYAGLCLTRNPIPYTIGVIVKTGQWVYVNGIFRFKMR